MRAGRAGGRMVAACTAVAVAGCGLIGGDDDSAEDGPSSYGQEASAASLRVPDDLDADRGCGDEASTDPADLAADRAVARCAPGTPTPVPLAQPTSLRIGVRARTEDVAPILLADHLDEFAKENLNVEISAFVTANELFDALESGAVDVVAGELDGPFFDGVAAGSGARIVLGGPVAPAAHDTDTPQAGLWLRTDLLDETETWVDLEQVGLPIAVQDSIGDAAVYPVDFVLQQDDVSLNEVNVSVVSGEAAAEQLLNGDLSGAWLTDPYWREVPDSDLQIELVATLPVTESLGGVVLAKRLVDPARDRAVGVAFSRAVIRTINSYLAGDYQEDDDVVAALVELTGQIEDDIVDTPAWVFDWEVRSNTTQRIQEALILLGGVNYEEQLGERQLVDRSLYGEAVGSSPN